MSNMPEIKWEEPERDQRKTAHWRSPYVEALKARPGVWALVEENKKYSSATHSWKRLGCEATARTNPDKTCNIYARWPEQ